MWNGSKVLITGGTGMVSRYVQDLLQNRYDVHIEIPDRKRLNLESKTETVDFFNQFKPEYVFHLAGKVHGLGGNLMYPLETLSTNVLINDAVFTACSQDSVKKVFFAGTVASYKYPFEQLPLREESLFEGDPHDGEYGYAMAKRLAYSYLKLLSEKFNKKFVYGVYTNLYGPHDRFNIVSGHVVPSLISKLERAVSNGTSLEVWGRPETTRDFMFVEDAARAAIFLMETSEGIYNIGSGQENTMQSLVNSLVEASNFNGRIVWNASKPVGISRRYSDVEKLFKLGFQVKSELPVGIKKTWNWYCDAITNKNQIRK